MEQLRGEASAIEVKVLSSVLVRSMVFVTVCSLYVRGRERD